MLSGSGSPQGSRTMRQAAINHMNDEDCYTLYQFAGLDTTDDMQVLFNKNLISSGQRTYGLYSLRVLASKST